MKVYFDYGATTPVHPKVLEAMLPYLKDSFGNPSSIHEYGRKIKVEIENARENIADFINADPSEIYFTSGGTEAINFIIKEIAKTEFQESGRNQILSSTIEHHAVIDTCKSIKEYGFKTKFLSPNKLGVIDPGEVEKQLDNSISIMALMHINNELGSVNPIEKFADLGKNIGAHTFADCVQSFGKFKLDVKAMELTAISGSAHKIYGPKGIGFAYVKSGTPLASMLHGGSQERNRRGGTENVPGIIGLSQAVNIARNEMEENFKKALSLREVFREGIRSIDGKGISINGDDTNSPFINSISFNEQFYDIDSESMLIYLDINGVAVSSGSACNSGTVKASHVIKGIGRTDKTAEGTLRISFGRNNTPEEVMFLLENLEKLTKKIKK